LISFLLISFFLFSAVSVAWHFASVWPSLVEVPVCEMEDGWGEGMLWMGRLGGNITVDKVHAFLYEKAGLQ